MGARIPTTIITGFLGAGKTSLMRHLVESANGRRLAFLINEFGDLGIDRDLLLGCGIPGCDDDDVVELANGCICCTVADDFLPAMESILDREEQPDHILIETSGLALPKPLVKAFTWPEIRARVTVDSVITVVDGPAVLEGRFAEDPAAVQAQRVADPALDHESPLEEVFSDQLQCADVVVLNKADLVAAEIVGDLESQLTPRLRAGVKIIHAENARVDPTLLIGLDARAESDLESRPSHHDGTDDHDHDDFDSVVLRFGSIDDVAALESGLHRVIEEHGIFRIKGFLDRPAASRREVIQAVGPRIERYFDRAWSRDEARESELVLIGLATLDRTSIAACLTETLAAPAG